MNLINIDEKRKLIILFWQFQKLHLIPILSVTSRCSNKLDRYIAAVSCSEVTILNSSLTKIKEKMKILLILLTFFVFSVTQILGESTEEKSKYFINLLYTI